MGKPVMNIIPFPYYLN